MNFALRARVGACPENFAMKSGFGELPLLALKLPANYTIGVVGDSHMAGVVAVTGCLRWFASATYDSLFVRFVVY